MRVAIRKSNEYDACSSWAHQHEALGVKPVRTLKQRMRLPEAEETTSGISLVKGLFGVRLDLEIRIRWLMKEKQSAGVCPKQAENRVTENNL